jgi:hypothetical protein
MLRRRVLAGAVPSHFASRGNIYLIKVVAYIVLVETYDAE